VQGLLWVTLTLFQGHQVKDKFYIQQAISWEPFGIQCSYFAWGTMVWGPSISIMMDDLDIDLDLLPGQGLCNTFQSISWEPFDPKSSYFAWGTMLGRPSRFIMIGDLDLLSQGHSLAGHILRTIWLTQFIFCMGY
jgi:hypothetical protein